MPSHMLARNQGQQRRHGPTPETHINEIDLILISKERLSEKHSVLFNEELHYLWSLVGQLN